MTKVFGGLLVLFAFVFLLATLPAGAQIVFVAGQNCQRSNELAPLGPGEYTGVAVECSVSALCSEYPIIFKYIYADAWSGLACPTDFVTNGAQSGWNTVDTVNANAIAFDEFNWTIRGSAFSQESCQVATPITFRSDYPNVCGSQIDLPDPGPEPGLPPGGEPLPGPPPASPVLCIAPGGPAPCIYPEAITLVTNTAPAFTSLAQGRFAPAVAKLTPAMRNSTVILSNNSSKAVAGYVLKWTETSKGVSHASFEAYDQLTLVGGKIPNEKGLGIKAHTARILSPAFNLSESDMDNFSTGSGLDHALASHPASIAIKQGSVFTPSINLVVYDDGTFEGPDEMLFSKRMADEHNARRDAGLAFISDQGNGRTTQEIQTRLQAAIDAGSTALSLDASDSYNQSRGRYASQLLMIFQRYGVNVTLSNATRFANTSKVTLQRVP